MNTLIVTFFIVGIPIFIWIVRKLWLRSLNPDKRVCILVLGDLGRSPRMQYHALSFLEEGYLVDLIGYPGSSPMKKLIDHPLLKIYHLQPPPDTSIGLPRMAYYALKVIWQSMTIIRVLFSKPISKYLLIQNPPAVPTLPICWCYCRIYNIQFTIDWHNYAYTLLALSLKKNHLLVKITKIIEMYFGSKADNNICVTQAMNKDLQQWNIKSTVLYDRPPQEFHPISLKVKHEFLLQLSEIYGEIKGTEKNSTIFTKCTENNEISHLPTRPGLLVSSTSWTEDEDFFILLNVLQGYELCVKHEVLKLPNLICVITGKGPMRDFYIAMLKLKNWKHVTVITPWLEIEDYPKMLGSADLGVCLHKSSSGLDLPMKVVDMFGCGLPVCAYNFKCLNELVKHNENGFVFSNDKELLEQIKLWFQEFPNNKNQQDINDKFQQNLKSFREHRWHGNWSLNVLPIFQ